MVDQTPDALRELGYHLSDTTGRPRMRDLTPACREGVRVARRPPHWLRPVGEHFRH